VSLDAGDDLVDDGVGRLSGQQVFLWSLSYAGVSARAVLSQNAVWLRAWSSELDTQMFSITPSPRTTMAPHRGGAVGVQAVSRVEVPGIEPGCSGTRTGLLRAQLTVLFSAFPVSPTSREQAQPQ